MIQKQLLSLITGVFFLMTAAPLQAVQSGEKVPPFHLTTLDGKILDSKELIGKNPMFFVFWATWCPTCTDEIPQINKLVREFSSQGMKFVGINVGVNDSAEKARLFAEKHAMEYPVYFDDGTKLTREFKVQGTPTIILTDKQGIVRYRGFSAPRNLDDNFTYLLQ